MLHVKFKVFFLLVLASLYSLFRFLSVWAHWTCRSQTLGVVRLKCFYLTEDLNWGGHLLFWNLFILLLLCGSLDNTKYKQHVYATTHCYTKCTQATGALHLSQREVTISASLTHASERYHKTSWCAASVVCLPHVQHKQNYRLCLQCVKGSDIPLIPAMADWFCWSTSARSLVTPYHHGDWRQQKCSLSTQRVH